MATRTINVRVGEVQNSFPLSRVVGAFINYAPVGHPAHPTIPELGLRGNMGYFDTQLSSAISRTRPILAGPHGYSGSSWPASFSGTAVSWAPADGWPYSWINVKIPGGYPGWAGAATGSFDTYLTNYVNSVPVGHNHVLIVEHEPENTFNGGPSADGGVWEGQYGPAWSQMQGRFANIVAALDRPNVYLAVCLMTFSFPNNGIPGTLGGNSRDPRKWNAWQYMNADAKARTIFAPDGYTTMNTTGFETMASEYDNVRNYVAADNWGIEQWGVTEHTINNDVNRTPTAVASVWTNDIRPYMRNWPNLAYYLVFNNATELASGNNGWVDTPEEYAAFGKMAWEFNTGEVIA